MQEIPAGPWPGGAGEGARPSGFWARLGAAGQASVIVAIVALPVGAVSTAFGGYLERERTMEMFGEQSRLAIRSEFLKHLTESRDHHNGRSEVLTFYSYVLRDSSDALLKEYVELMNANNNRAVEQEENLASRPVEPVEDQVAPEASGSRVPAVPTRPSTAVPRPATALPSVRATASAAPTAKATTATTALSPAQKEACTRCRDECIKRSMETNKLTRETAISACRNTCASICTAK